MTQSRVGRRVDHAVVAFACNEQSIEARMIFDHEPFDEAEPLSHGIRPSKVCTRSCSRLEVGRRGRIRDPTPRLRCLGRNVRVSAHILHPLNEDGLESVTGNQRRMPVGPTAVLADASHTSRALQADDGAVPACIDRSPIAPRVPRASPRINFPDQKRLIGDPLYPYPPHTPMQRDVSGFAGIRGSDSPLARDRVRKRLSTRLTAGASSRP